MLSVNVLLKDHPNGKNKFNALDHAALFVALLDLYPSYSGFDVTAQKPLADPKQNALQPSKTVEGSAKSEVLPVKNKKLRFNLPVKNENLLFNEQLRFDFMAFLLEIQCVWAKKQDEVPVNIVIDLNGNCLRSKDNLEKDSDNAYPQSENQIIFDKKTESKIKKPEDVSKIFPESLKAKLVMKNGELKLPDGSEFEAMIREKKREVLLIVDVGGISVIGIFSSGEEHYNDIFDTYTGVYQKKLLRNFYFE